MYVMLASSYAANNANKLALVVMVSWKTHGSSSQNKQTVRWRTEKALSAICMVAEQYE